MSSVITLVSGLRTEGDSNTDGAWGRRGKPGLGTGRAGFKIQNLARVVMAEEDLWDTQQRGQTGRWV